MTHKLKYNSDNIDMIYNSLLNLSNQGKPKDFEIKIDGLTVVYRTNRLNKFSLYRKSMFEFSNEVTFMIYKGSSRVNDKYILSRNLLTNNSNIDIKTEVDRIVKREQHEQEFKRLQEVEIYQKNKIQKLKTKIEEMESQKTGDIKEVFNSIRTLLPSNANAEPPMNAETRQMLAIINRTKLTHGNQTTHEAFAVGLTLAETPSLIDDVKLFINKKKEEKENEED